MSDVKTIHSFYQLYARPLYARRHRHPCRLRRYRQSVAQPGPGGHPGNPVPFSVPAFFFLSAFGMFYSQPLDQPFVYKDYLRRRLRTVFVPYLAWSLFYMVYVSVISHNFSVFQPYAFSVPCGTAWPCIIFTSWSSSCGSTSSCPCGGRSCASWIKHRGCRLLFSSSPTWPSTSIPVISGRSIPTIPSSRTLSTSV